MAKKAISTKEALSKAFTDTMSVLLWSGVPATGVVGFLVLLGEDVPVVARYAAYIATAVNILGFFAKRTYEYKTGRRE